MERAMKCRRALGVAVVAALSAALAACGADSHTSGETVLTGIVVVPDTGCPGCSSDGSLVRVQALQKNGEPATIKCVRTSLRGVYDSADVDVCPQESTTTFQAAQDGQQTVIVVADVGAAIAELGPPQIGGVLAAPIGATKSKDFTGTTQIACVASVYLTMGNTDASQGCVVLPSCSGPTVGGVPCFQTLDPNAIRNDQIQNLVGERVRLGRDHLPRRRRAGGVRPSSTAPTGAQPTTADCVEGRLRG
jgi:hypothetical protein